jgi:hypothetical protein
MRKVSFSLALFFVLAALFGPAIALLIVLAFSPAVLFVLFGVLALVLVAGAAIFLGAKGTAKLAKTLSGSPLPRSVARSVAESRHYGRLIMRVAQQYPPGPMRDRLNLTLKPVNEWLLNLTRLEQGLTKLYLQRPLARELSQTALEIDDLRRRSLAAQDDLEIQTLRDLMESKKQHLAALKALQAFQTQAELKIRKIAADLGRTHAEMLLLVARGDFNDNRINRLDQNLQENLSSLRDMLAAMDELGYSRAAG